MNGAAPRLWTGEAVLDHALEVAGFKVEDLQRSMAVTREALEAEKDGSPDHATRLRASENIFGWIGLRGTRKPAEGGFERPVNIAIVLQQPDAQPQLSAGGLTVHLTGHNGVTRDGGVRDAGGRQDVGGVRDDDRPRPAAS